MTRGTKFLVHSMDTVLQNQPTILEMDHLFFRRLGLVLWIFALAMGLYLYLFRPEAVRTALGALSLPKGAPVWGVAAAYVALGCLRGFTLLPATSLVPSARSTSSWAHTLGP